MWEALSRTTTRVTQPSCYLGNGLWPAKEALESSLSGGALGVRAAGPPKGLLLSWKTTHVHTYTQALCTHPTRVHATGRPHINTHHASHVCTHSTRTHPCTHMHTPTPHACALDIYHKHVHARHTYLPQAATDTYTCITQIYTCHVDHTSHICLYSTCSRLMHIPHYT